MVRETLSAAAVAVLGLTVSATPLVFDPGYGNTTNVTDYIGSWVDGVTVESGTVNLLSDLSLFSGDVTVDSGVLGVAQLRSDGGPSSIGLATNITLRPGTAFRYLAAGPDVSDASLTFEASAANDVFTVDAAGDFTLRGAMVNEADACGRFVKTGSGTFTIGTTELPEGTSNYLGRAEAATPYTVEVRDGGLAIATGDDVTTVLGSKAYSYVDDKDGATKWAYKGRMHVGVENGSAHLDIFSGKCRMADRIIMGAPDATTSFNMYGGDFAQMGAEGTIVVGDVSTDDINAGKGPGDSSLNVYGGFLKVHYIQVTPRRGTKGRVFLSGGTIQASLYGAHDNGGTSFEDPLTPEMEVYICTNGVLKSNFLQLSRLGLSRARVYVVDGGTLELNGQGLSASRECDGEILLDGGNLTLAVSNNSYITIPKSDGLGSVTFRIGESMSTLTVGNNLNYTITAPVVSGVTGGVDGGLSIMSSGTGSIRFTGATTYTGPTRLASGAKLRISSDLSLSSLVALDEDVNLLYDVSGSTVPLVTVNGFDVPGIVRVEVSGTLADGTYDILSVPVSASADADRFLLANASDAKAVAFAVRTSDGRKIVSMTLAPRTVSTSYWQTAAGGDWDTAANWSAAPASSPDARVAFATAASAQGNAVTLAAPVTLGGMTFAAAPGYSISGSTITLDNGNAEATVSVTAGESTLATPLAVRHAATVDTASGATLNLSGVFSGGPLTLNSAKWPNRSGTVRLSGANTFTRPLKFNSGKVSVSSIADAGMASPAGAGSVIDIGKATFEYAGGIGSTDRTIFLDTGDRYRMAAIGVAEGSTLTLTGQIVDPYGGLHKCGKGTLILAGAHDYVFAPNGNGYSLKTAWDIFSDWGDAIPTLAGGVVSSGRLELGAPGQSVFFTKQLVVGTRTTSEAGKETGAEVVINGGETRTGTLYVGHDNGTLATSETEVLTNRITVNSGRFEAAELYLGYQYYRNSRQHSEIVVNGGKFAITSYARLGCTDNTTDHLSTVRVVLNGGMIELPPSTFIGASTNSPLAGIEINGGVYRTRQLRYSWQSDTGEPHRTIVNEGGALRVYGPVNAGTGATSTGSYVLFDGGTYQPEGTSAQIESNVYVHFGEKGAVFDTTYLTSGYAAQVAAGSGGTWMTHPGVEADGGLTVQGPAVASRAISFVSATGYNFNGPVTVKEGGVLLAKTTAFASKDVTVKSGGAFGAFGAASANAETTVATLALEDGATIVAAFNGSSRGMVRATGSLTQAGTVYVVPSKSSGYSYPLSADNGTYPVVRGPVGSLDVSKFALSPRYASSSSATFSLVSGDGYDEVRMVLSNASTRVPLPMTVKTWTATTGGNWTEAGNWDVAPADENTDHIVLPATLTTPATISLGGGKRHIGALTSSAAGEIALADGSLYLSRYFIDSYPVVSNTVGTLILPGLEGHAGVGTAYAIRLEPGVGATQVVSGTVTSPTRIYGNSTYGCGGTIRFDHPNSIELETKSGTVEGYPENLGTAIFDVYRSTLRFAGGGISRATVKGSNGLHLRTEDDVFSYGAITNASGPFIKTGKGTLYLLSPVAARLSNTSGSSPSDDQKMAWQMPANGDLPNNTEGQYLASGNIASGKLVLGLTGATTTFGGHMRLGCSLVDFDENGDVLDSEIEVYGGKVVFENDLYIARNCGFYRQYRDSAKRRNATFSVHGGEVRMVGLYMQHDSTGYFNGNANLNIYGGTVTSTGGYIIFNRDTTTKLTGYGKSHAYINIYGGMFTNTYYTAAKEVDGASNVGGLQSYAFQKGDLDINLFGGDFAWTAALTVKDAGTSKVRVNFAGGRLTARYLRKNNSAGEHGLFWNGGTYQPTRDGATLRGRVVEDGNEVISRGIAWTYNTCSTNGANFQIPAGNTFTLDQALTHDADLGDVRDGGLASIGEGTLVLGEANTFTGPVKAMAGTIRVDADGAIPAGADLELSDGVIDLNSHGMTAGDVTGSGGWVRNGTVTVTGRVTVSGGDGSWVGMDAVAFGAGSVFAPRYSYSAAAQTWTGDYLKLAGSATGVLTVDLGRTAENPLPKGFRLKIAELPAAAASPEVHVLNWGETPKTSVTVTRTVSGDIAEICVEIVGKGSAFILR